MLSQAVVNPIDWASGNAGNSEVTIAVLGISGLLEGEEGESLASATAGDRLDYNLPINQIDYLKKMRKAADKNSNNKKANCSCNYWWKPNESCGSTRISGCRFISLVSW